MENISCRALADELEPYYRSGNSIPIERASIPATLAHRILAALRASRQPPSRRAVKVNEDVLDAFLDNQSAGSDLQACLEAAISVYLGGITK